MKQEVIKKRNKDIIRLRKSGASVAYLSDIFHLSPVAIYKVLDRNRKGEYNNSIIKTNTKL